MHEIEMGAGRTPFHSTSFSVLSTQKYLLPTLLSLFSVLGGGESCASAADCHPHAQAGIRSIAGATVKRQHMEALHVLHRALAAHKCRLDVNRNLDVQGPSLTTFHYILTFCHVTYFWREYVVLSCVAPLTDGSNAR